MPVSHFWSCQNIAVGWRNTTPKNEDENITILPLFLLHSLLVNCAPLDPSVINRERRVGFTVS